MGDRDVWLRVDQVVWQHPEGVEARYSYCGLWCLSGAGWWSLRGEVFGAVRFEWAAEALPGTRCDYCGKVCTGGLLGHQEGIPEIA